jgi:hypothetical protein
VLNYKYSQVAAPSLAQPETLRNFRILNEPHQCGRITVNSAAMGHRQCTL